MSHLKQVIDQLTGEILESTITNRKKVKPDEFMQVYLHDMAGLMQIKTLGQVKVLVWLWKDSTWYESTDTYPGNKVTINKQLIDFIAGQIGLKEGVIRNAVSYFVKVGILLKDSSYRGVYYMNPIYFFKGKIGDRNSKLYYKHEYLVEKDLDEKEKE